MCRGGVKERDEEWKEVHRAGVTAGFVALGDEEVRAGADGLARVAYRLDLAHDLGAGGLRLRGVGAGVAEGQGEDAGLSFDGGVE